MEHCSKLTIHTSWELHKLPADKATHRVRFSLPESSTACIDLRLSTTKSTLLQGDGTMKMRKTMCWKHFTQSSLPGEGVLLAAFDGGSGFLVRQGSFCNNASPKRNMRCPVVKRLRPAVAAVPARHLCLAEHSELRPFFVVHTARCSRHIFFR